MEIGFRINLYRNTVDALVDTTQDAENATQATQGTTQVRLTEEDKDVLAAIKEQHNITQKARKIKLCDTDRYGNRTGTERCPSECFGLPAESDGGRPGTEDLA